MLSDILVVAYADLNSGSIRSVEYAKKMGKKIYVLPHRIGESQGTNQLLKDGLAQAIYDIDEFVGQFGDIQSNDTQDEFLQYCGTNPSYDEAVFKYSSQVFEYELGGKIIVQNGFIYLA
jgi:DNA processing protein